MKKVLLLLAIVAIAITTNAQTTTVGGQTSIGLKVTLQQNDTHIIYPFFWEISQDTVLQVINGPKYWVVGSYSQYYSHPAVGNYIYWFVELQAVDPNSPIQYLVYPSYFTKIAFGGGISR